VYQHAFSVHSALSERRVFVRLKGGIGNQLFQFAYALLLAGGRSENVFCDLEYFRRDARHGGFALGELLGDEVHGVDGMPPGNQFLYVNADLLAGEDLSSLAQTRVDLLIDGYFQHINHVVPVIDTMKQMFRRQFDQGEFLERLRAQAASAPRETLVALHFRRGDFLDPAIRQIHGVPTVESMVSCLNQLEPQPSATIVFSDSKLPIDLPCQMIDLSRSRDGSLAQDIDQFRLMSCCNAIIASNSTFSYWAGLLSDRVRQLLIPDPWMRSGSVTTQSLLKAGVSAYSTELI
jgi:hypothetical protein